MIRWFHPLAAMLSWLACLPAAEPVRVELVAPETKDPWLGQRLDFAVEVAVEGRFDGATLFDLPELPGAILFKPEARPVLSSREIDGREFSVQRHGFSLFCQAPGTLTVKGIRARCGSIIGFGGEPQSHRLEVPEFRIEPRAQPGLVAGQVVVTSRSFDVEERWDPEPGEAKPGDAFRRTVTITAGDVPGMLLPKLPQPDLDGLAVYPSAASVDDRTERGAFTGRRSESVTYLCETGGEFRLPAVRFRSWHPEQESWIIRELPAVTITAARQAGAAEAPAAGTRVPWLRIAAVIALLLAGIVIAVVVRRARTTPEALEFAAFREACAGGSPAAAVHAFHRWRALTGGGEPGDRLRLALRTAEEAIIGRHPDWSGPGLLAAARAERKRRSRRQADGPALARLNP